MLQLFLRRIIFSLLFKSVNGLESFLGGSVLLCETKYARVEFIKIFALKIVSENRDLALNRRANKCLNYERVVRGGGN